MTKAPQIKAQALTAGLFHAHKPPLVPAHFALPIIRAIPSCLSSGKLFPAFHTGHSSLSFIRATLPCLSYRPFFPVFHPGNSSLPFIQATLPCLSYRPFLPVFHPGNSFLTFIRATLPCLSYRPFCYLPQRSNLILAIHPCPATANRHQGRSAVSLSSTILSLQFTPGRLQLNDY